MPERYGSKGWLQLFRIAKRGAGAKGPEQMRAKPLSLLLTLTGFMNTITMHNMRKYAVLLLAPALLLAADPDAKIDRGLINKLLNSDDGTASFFVEFGDRTPLAAASHIPDWNLRGQAVVNALQGTANRSQAGVRGYLQ